MVSQPDQQELTFAERVEIQRKRDIERALAAGNPELAEVLRTVEYEEVSPEERVEIERALEAARNQTEWEEPDAFLKEWREEDPEFVDMLDRVDERFPGWGRSSTACLRITLRITLRISRCFGSWMSTSRRPQSSCARFTKSFGCLDLLSRSRRPRADLVEPPLPR